jgi:hypothetical protein
VNATDTQGLTPLHEAASCAHLPCLKILIKYGGKRLAILYCRHCYMHGLLERCSAEFLGILHKKQSIVGLQSAVLLSFLWLYVCRVCLCSVEILYLIVSRRVSQLVPV